MQLLTQAHTHTHTYTHTHTHTQIYTHIHTHTHAQSNEKLTPPRLSWRSQSNCKTDKGEKNSSYATLVMRFTSDDTGQA